VIDYFQSASQNYVVKFFEKKDLILARIVMV